MKPSSRLIFLGFFALIFMTVLCLAISLPFLTNQPIQGRLGPPQIQVSPLPWPTQRYSRHISNAPCPKCHPPR